MKNGIKVLFILYFATLVFFIGRIVFFADLQDFIFVGNEAEGYDYSSDWVLDSGEHVNLYDISAGKLGGSFCVSKVLPDKMLETDSIYLSTSNLCLNIFVDDNLLYSYETRENLTGNGDGVSYHMIALGVKDEGKTIRIEAQAAFADGRGGNINILRYGPEKQFRYYMMRRNFVAESLSVLMVIFGLAVIAVFFVVCRTSPMFRPLWALGLSAIIYGLWSVCDTGMPQLLMGNIYTCREIIYLLPFLVIFPMIYFVNCITKTKRNIYLYLSFMISLGCFGWLLFSRFVLGTDLHAMTGPIYFTYFSAISMFAVLLVDNEVYCRKKKVSSNLKYFYLGAVIFVVTCFIDILRYIVGKKVAIGRGNWFRFGLVIFFALMAYQLYVWWSSEKVSLERDRFINRLLQYVMDMEDPESKLGKVLEYLCKELNADRAYIFEDNHDGTFDNTYEYCAEGVTPEIDNLKGLPFDGVIDVWYHEFEKDGHVLINDLEKYREVSENMYNVLKP